MDTNYIIETKNLTKQYGSQKSVADLNIHVKRGKIYGLLGRNGAGKTTTMKMLLGLTKPTSGEVKIWGKSLQGNEKKLLPRIGSLIESPGFYPNLTGTENLRIFATLRGVPNNHAIKDALDLVGLPYKDKKLFSQYSLGMKQRLAIALAVMHDPELLILDEPINGLDPIGIAEVRSFIRELCDARGKTILISSHILSEISLLADDIGIIDHGALLEEESLAELEQKSSKHIRFTLSDTAQAARILERNFHETHFSIQDDHNLRLHNMELPVGKIVTAFVENGLEVSEAGSFLVGVIIAFVYGYGGMFAAGNMTLANLYPITASLGMVGYRSYDTAVNWNIGTCSCSLALAVVISAILILCMKEREATQTKKKAKKVAPKKGW